jgi:hypothetical protein
LTRRPGRREDRKSGPCAGLCERLLLAKVNEPRGDNSERDKKQRPLPRLLEVNFYNVFSFSPDPRLFSEPVGAAPYSLFHITIPNFTKKNNK